jgi:hypothetical protein
MAAATLAACVPSSARPTWTLAPHGGARWDFRMVRALIVQDKAAAISLASAGAPAYLCVIPGAG